jgi:hypothetical protein
MMFLEHFSLNAHPFTEKPPIEWLLRDEHIDQALGLRLPREKRRDKAFVLLYHQGHENYKQYQRDAVRP